jgi:hypothetical protein
LVDGSPDETRARQLAKALRKDGVADTGDRASKFREARRTLNNDPQENTVPPLSQESEGAREGGVTGSESWLRRAVHTSIITLRFANTRA